MTLIESHSPNCYKVGGPYPCTCRPLTARERRREANKPDELTVLRTLAAWLEDWRERDWQPTSQRVVEQLAAYRKAFPEILDAMMREIGERSPSSGSSPVRPANND